jgi:hypothetical protein
MPCWNHVSHVPQCVYCESNAASSQTMQLTWEAWIGTPAGREYRLWDEAARRWPERQRHFEGAWHSAMADFRRLEFTPQDKASGGGRRGRRERLQAAAVARFGFDATNKNLWWRASTRDSRSIPRLVDLQTAQANVGQMLGGTYLPPIFSFAGLDPDPRLPANVIELMMAFRAQDEGHGFPGDFLHRDERRRR